MRNRWLMALIAAMALVLASCSTIFGDGETLPETGNGELPPSAVLEAQEQLSDMLGVSVESIQVIEFEQVDWPDACLGLPQEGEACAQVITPGFRVVLEVNGEQHVFRTDREGNVVRLAPQE